MKSNLFNKNADKWGDMIPGAEDSLLKKADVPDDLAEVQRVVPKEYDAVRYVAQWYLNNNVQTLSWRDFQKTFQQFAAKYIALFTEIRKNKPQVALADLQEWLQEQQYNDTEAPAFNVSYDRYQDAEHSHRDVEQLVLQINQGANAEQILGEDSILKEYVDMVGQAGEMSGHPAAQNTIGWLRVDFIDQDWLLVDEVQSDLVNSVSQAKLILEADTFNEFMTSLANDQMRQMVREKGIVQSTFQIAKQRLSASGYTLDKMEDIRLKLIELSKNWAEYAISTVLEIARRHDIKRVAIHTVESIGQRDPSVEADKLKIFYDNLARSFGFKKEQVNVEGLRGNFWVRTASSDKTAANGQPLPGDELTWVSRNGRNYVADHYDPNQDCWHHKNWCEDLGLPYDDKLKRGYAYIDMEEKTVELSAYGEFAPSSLVSTMKAQYPELKKYKFTDTVIPVNSRYAAGKKDDLAPLLELAKQYPSFQEFNDAVTADNMVDLSNHDLHRWGRAFRDNTEEEEQISVADIEATGQYLDDIRMSTPRTYGAIRNGSKSIRMYRAVPPTTEQMITFFLNEKAHYLRYGSRRPSKFQEAQNFQNGNRFFEYLIEELGRIKAGTSGFKGVASSEIHIGDYVALDRDYAKMHGESILMYEQKYPTYKIVSKTVPKTDVIWNGDDFNEWSYSPNHVRQFTLEDVYNRAHGKTAAARQIYYHGTEIKNLRSILTQGLIPNPKEKSWADDPDAGMTAPSRQTYGGVYLTRNMMTAMAAVRHGKSDPDFRMVMVIVEAQPNSLFLDEDSIVSTLDSPFGNYNQDTAESLVGEYFMMTLPGAPASLQEAYQGMQERYIENVLKYLKHQLEENKLSMAPDLEKRLRELLPSVLLASLTRRVSHAYKSNEKRIKQDGYDSRNYDYRTAYRRVFGDRADQVEIPDKATVIPTPQEGERIFREAAEPLTRTLRSMLRIQQNGGWSFQNGRTTQPIGYSGSNRITAVLELREGRGLRIEYNDPEGYQGKGTMTAIVVHYGTVPEDFKQQWNERVGNKIHWLKPGEAQPSSTYTPPPKRTDVNDKYEVGKATYSETYIVYDKKTGDAAAFADSEQEAVTKAMEMSQSVTASVEETRYTAEQVKEMADAKGLPCEINKRKGISFVTPQSTLETLGLYREWSHYLPVPQWMKMAAFHPNTEDHAKMKAFRESMQFPLTIYRAFNENPETINMENLGPFWSVDEELAEPHLQDNSKRTQNSPTIVRAVVNEKDIDWEETFYQNMRYDWSEKEVFIPPSTGISLTGIKQQGDWEAPTEQYVFASKQASKWPSWAGGKKLYHGTSMSGIVGILKDNAIYEGIYWNKPNEPHGVRFTTDKKVANTFAMEGLGGDEGAIIELDGSAIAKTYRTVEYEDQDCLGNKWKNNEKEVVALTKKVAPVTKFITAIYLKNPFTKQSDTEDYAGLVETEERMSAAEWLAGYNALMKNPLVRNPLIPKKAAEAEPWQTHRDQYAGRWLGEDETEEQTRERHRKSQTWEQSMGAALSLGKITPEEARQRGVLYIDEKGFKPLPQTLYHVTTHLEGVMAHGLKSRFELSQQEGHGLGGGSEFSASFTEDLNIAKGIYDAIVEARQVARGELTIADMLKQAEAGTGAKNAWATPLVRYKGLVRDWNPGQPYPMHLDAMLRGVRIETKGLGAVQSDIKQGLTPVQHPDQVSWQGRDEPVYRYWERPSTDAEKQDEAFDFYKAFCAFREEAGGAMNPLFFSSNVEALAGTDVSNVAILQFRPVPGAMGTQESALGEWRTYSGQAVELVGKIDPQA